MTDNAYAAAQRASLDAKVTELRAEGWDVVARRSRDLAFSQRDDVAAERDAYRAALVLIRDSLTCDKRTLMAKASIVLRVWRST